MSFKRFLGAYYLGHDPGPPLEELEFDEDGEGQLVVTGNALIENIYDAIRMRRPVLVTGPRGSGKSYCCEQAIREAAPLPANAPPRGPGERPRRAPIIGAWYFLQGNREIPRDYLSEDMLVVGKDRRLDLRRAIVLRSPDVDDSDVTTEFPAIPTSDVVDYQAAMKQWESRHWSVLYLDEINRFGDGFLDSLLSLTEEGKVVRRGREYYVPIIVVATANPPGYDITAKKLSPPLQARIARSYRVSQPPLETMVAEVLRRMQKKVEDRYESEEKARVVIRPELLRAAAATTLCLWGDPSKRLSGHFFLTRATRYQLRAAMTLDDELAKAMRTITSYLVFGPDARAAADWLVAATASSFQEWNREGRKGNIEVEPKHFKATALQVLAHKVRESFNEGTEPEKTVAKERCISVVVDRVFDEAKDVFRFFATTTWVGAFGKLDPNRAAVWEICLSAAPKEWLEISPSMAKAPAPIRRWVEACVIPFGALDEAGAFLPGEEFEVRAVVRERIPGDGADARIEALTLERAAVRDR